MEEQNGIFWPGWETGPIIGRGSFGEVYEIHRDVFGTLEQAALKVITIPQNASDIDAMYSDGYDQGSITSNFQYQLERIVKEYTLMRSMSSCPYIVRCDDVRYIQHDDGIGWDIYIKMELLTPLTKVLTQDITKETVIQIGMDICRALERCSREQIIHRDIKPQNILLSAEGIFKLGDFGIAKTVERTMGGTQIGSYDYMAPEVNFFQPYGKTVDIYSLGLVLYWLLNERRGPFVPLPPAKIIPGMKEEAWTRRMRGEPLPSPVHGSEALKAIVMKACAFEPSQRYSSAQEMLEALQSLTECQSEPMPEPIPEPEPILEPDPMDEIWVQQPPVNDPPVENLDVRQTLRFAYEDNPAGKAIDVQVGNETVQVWIPEQFENGQTFYYEGMGLKSAYSEKRGDLYLTVQVEPAPVQGNANKPTQSKKMGVIAAAIACVVLLGGVLWGLISRNMNRENIRGTETDDKITSTRWEQNIMMQDSIIGVDQARKILGSDATDDDIVDFCAEHPVLGSEIPRSQIMSVTFLDSVASAPSSSWDVSAGHNGSVLAWIIPNGELFDLFIAGEGGVNGALVTPHMFFMYINLREVHFNGDFYSDNSTDMVGMFYYCISLEKVDVSSLNTSAVENMRYMFHECRNLKSLDVSGFDTSSVSDMGYMFNGCGRLQKLDVSGFNTSSSEDMTSMFDGCSSLEALDVSRFDTSSVMGMTWLFSRCSSLKKLDVRNFDTSSVTKMGGMFYGCSSLETLDVSSFDTSSVTDMFWMFANCSSLKMLDLNSFNTSSVTNMQMMFEGCNSLETLDVTGFDTSSVMYMDYMFDGCTSLQSLDVRNFDLSNATNTEGFYIDNGVVRYEGY